MTTELVPMPDFILAVQRKRNHYSVVTHYCHEAVRVGEIRPTKCRALLVAARTGSDLVFVESRLQRLDIDIQLVQYYRKSIDRCIIAGLKDEMPYSYITATVQAAATSVQLYLDQLDDGSRKLKGEDHFMPDAIEHEDW